MPIQSNPLRVVRESPVRAFAREACRVTGIDVRTGVLLERIANYLCSEVRGRQAKPVLEFAELPAGERNWYLECAVNIVGLVDDIDRGEPPTAAEVARYEQRK